MVTKFITSIAAVFLLLIFFFLTLLPLLIVRPHLEPAIFYSAFGTWIIITLPALVLVLNAGIKKIWFFPGNGDPVDKDDLLSHLARPNDKNIPVKINKKGHGHCVTWRYDDPAWCERLEISGMKRLYELRIVWEGATRTAIIKDRVRAINFDFCPLKVKTGFFSLPLCVFSCGKNLSQDQEIFREKALSEYQFTPAELKSQVMAAIINNGWNVRFSLF